MAYDRLEGKRMFKLEIDENDECIIKLVQVNQLKASASYFVECKDPIERMEKMVTSEVGKLFRAMDIVIDESLPEGSAAFVKEGKYIPKIVLVHNVKMEEKDVSQNEQD